MKLTQSALSLKICLLVIFLPLHSTLSSMSHCGVFGLSISHWYVPSSWSPKDLISRDPLGNNLTLPSSDKFVVEYLICPFAFSSAIFMKLSSVLRPTHHFKVGFAPSAWKIGHSMTLSLFLKPFKIWGFPHASSAMAVPVNTQGTKINQSINGISFHQYRYSIHRRRTMVGRG